MNATDFKSYYLQAMGITEWFLRQKATIDGHCLQFLGYKTMRLYHEESKKCTVLLIAEWDDSDDKKTTDQYHLFKKITTALTSQFEMHEFSLDSELKRFAQSLKKIIFLGEHVAQCILDTKDTIEHLRKKNIDFNNVPVMVTYSITSLLKDKSLKALAWEDIKSAKSLLR